jgi:hypothetical protein
LYLYIIIERLSIEIVLAVALAFAQFLTTINLLLWMAEQKPKRYSIYQTSLSIILIVGFGQIIATAIGTIIIKRGYLIFKLNNSHILKFGIPHSLGAWIATGADRLILIRIDNNRNICNGYSF